MNTLAIRQALPKDYEWIVSLVDRWWGRPVAGALPRLFLDHFHDTSFVAEDADGLPIGFLIGFISPSQEDSAYIHFVGVDPRFRRHGVARELYECFFNLASSAGRFAVTATTAPVNDASILFHRRMGFSVSDIIERYNGPGTAQVVFTRATD